MTEPVSTTTRGFNSAGTALEPGEAAFNLPRRADGRPATQDWPDFSSRVLTLNAGRNGDGSLGVSDLKEFVTIGDETRWDSIQWDPEAGLVVLIPDQDIIISTNPHGDVSDDNAGIPVDADTAFPLHVTGAPQGQIWVRRRASEAETNIRGYAYGSPDMVFSSRNAYGVSHDA